MRYRVNMLALACVTALAVVVASGCGSEPTNPTGSAGNTNTGGGGTGGTGTAGNSGGSSTTGSTGTAGTGGTGGNPAANGVQATEFVSSGGVAKSANYSMVFTLGQSTQNQGTTKSQNYQLRGGLIGAVAGQ